MGFDLRVLAHVRGYIVICSMPSVRENGVHASSSLRDKVLRCVLPDHLQDKDRNGVLTRPCSHRRDLPSKQLDQVPFMGQSQSHGH